MAKKTAPRNYVLYLSADFGYDEATLKSDKMRRGIKRFSALPDLLKWLNTVLNTGYTKKRPWVHYQIFGPGVDGLPEQLLFGHFERRYYNQLKTSL